MVLKQKVIYRYSLTSDNTRGILDWVNLNLKFLGQLVQLTDGRWNMLTNG